MATELVVDSSVAIKWSVIEPLVTEATAILQAYQAGALTLLAPDLIYAELGNIVWKKQTMQGLAAADAQRIISDILGLQLMTTPSAELFADGYRLAVAHRRTVYDALYLAERAAPVPLCHRRRAPGQRRGRGAATGRLAGSLDAARLRPGVCTMTQRVQYPFLAPRAHAPIRFSSVYRCI